MLRNKFFIPLAIILTAILLIAGINYSLKLTSANNNITSSNVQKSKIIFSDEFNNKSLDSTKWVTCYDWYDANRQGCSNYGNEELEWYMASQVKVEKGNLTLVAAKKEVGGVDKAGNDKTYPYVSGMISTGKSNMQTEPKWVNAYGYYEARMSVPGGKGVWPAFWLLPQGLEWPPEIDIMELLGDRPNEILNTYFWKDQNGNQAKDSGTYVGDTPYVGGWHVYAVEWQPGAISWYIDGKKVRDIKSENVPKIPLEMVLNLAVGGKLPGNPDASTQFPATMKVDYVRVYNSKP